MTESFEGLEVLDERSEGAVLREMESRLRNEVKAQGLDFREGDDVALQFSRRSTSEIDSREDLADYLESSTGRQEVKIVVNASRPNRRGGMEISEGVDARIDLDDNTFLDVYSALENRFDVRKAGFNLTGYGEDAQEAYRTAQPMTTFLLGHGDQDFSATVSYREGGTVETMWSENGDSYELFKALYGEGLAYEGLALSGDGEEEWLIADHGAENLYDSR